MNNTVNIMPQAFEQSNTWDMIKISQCKISTMFYSFGNIKARTVLFHTVLFLNGIVSNAFNVRCSLTWVKFVTLLMRLPFRQWHTGVKGLQQLKCSDLNIQTYQKFRPMQEELQHVVWSVSDIAKLVVSIQMHFS